MKIEERIKEVDLRPSDIVKLQVLTDAPIGLSQATGWIKNPTATKAIEQLLWRLCDEKVASGLTFSKPGRKKEGSAEIFSDKVRGQYGSMVVEFEPAKVEMNQGFYSPEAVLSTIKEKKTASQKIPAKRTHVILSATGHNSWGSDRTYKFVGALLRVNFGGKAYNALNVSKLPDDFIIEGTTYPVSEFTNVG